MARVTVEDCVRVIHNRFVLVVLASSRTRQLSTGEKAHIHTGKDKDPVVALKEIADKKVDPDKLENSYIAGFQKNLIKEEPEKDDFIMEESELEELPSILDDEDLDDIEKDDEDFDASEDLDLDGEEEFEDDIE